MSSLSWPTSALSGAALEGMKVSDLAEERWSALMSAAQRGDSRAYRDLLGEVRIWLMRYYSRRLPPEHVDDVVQEALIAVHHKRHTYDPQRPFKPWLTAVARYKWIDRLRSIGRDRSVELSEELAEGDHADVAVNVSALEDLLARLKPGQREAIRLVKLEGFSVEEAARRTGQSPSLIKVNIHRGLARLAAIVQEEPGDQ